MKKRRGDSIGYVRLTEPLVRENGAFRVATWDEALDRAAAGFRRSIDAHGADAMGVFSCSRSTNELNYLAQKLARTVWGTHNIDSCNRT
jgi:formate dehydrogenase major subunit